MNLTKKLAFPFIIVVFSILYLFSAWVADDAYITFRTIENFHQGYGLRWNIDERVQSYTHPLWMLNLLIGKYVIDDLYILSILLGCLFTSCTLYVLYQVTKKNLPIFFISSLLFLASKAVIDFSSSGLENSLSYALIGLFFINIVKNKETKFFYLTTSLILSAMFLNRMDLIIAFLPFALYLFFIEAYKLRHLKHSITQGLIGFIPVVLWSGFAIYYYGSFFANSVIAKTNIGLPRSHLHIQGFKYFYENLIYDPYTLSLILVTTVFALVSKQTVHKLLGIGLVCYCFYLLSVGADYMFGRFLTVPFTVCIFLIASASQTLILSKKTSVILSSIASILVAINVYQYTFKDTSKFITNNTAITDERMFYYQSTGLLPYLSTGKQGILFHFQETNDLLITDPNQPSILFTMGFNGYLAAKFFPNKHIIDLLGLTDNYLAAHPMNYGYWRIGHFRRVISNDYLASISENKNLMSDPQDAYVLQQAWLLSRAPLNDPQRIKAIINWHTGYTFKQAKEAFARYPHARLMNHEAKELKNLWIPH